MYLRFIIQQYSPHRYLHVSLGKLHSLHFGKCERLPGVSYLLSSHSCGYGTELVIITCFSTIYSAVKFFSDFFILLELLIVSCGFVAVSVCQRPRTRAENTKVLTFDFLDPSTSVPPSKDATPFCCSGLRQFQTPKQHRMFLLMSLDGAVRNISFSFQLRERHAIQWSLITPLNSTLLQAPPIGPYWCLHTKLRGRIP